MAILSGLAYQPISTGPVSHKVVNSGLLDWTAQTSYQIDVRQSTRLAELQDIQSVFVDNTLTTGALVITSRSNGFKLRVAPGAMGSFPFLAASDSPFITVKNTSGSGQSQLWFANVPAIGGVSYVAPPLGSLAQTGLILDGGPVAISSIGAIDWALFGDAPQTKAGGGATVQLQAAGGNVAYSDDARAMSWTNGTPTTAGSATKGMLNGAGEMVLTAPADTSLRTLTVFGGTHLNTVSYVASLSDHSALDRADILPLGFGIDDTDYTLTFQYRAAGPGQSFQLRWKNEVFNPGGNIRLQGAALS
jgi:hypothetical protein